MAKKKAGLDISEFAKGLELASVSSSDTGRDQIEYIDIKLLDSDEKNFYRMVGVDTLAANIQLCGLQQPIRVRPGKDGHFTIVSGHRRTAALRQLVKDGLDQFRQVPCIREREDGSAALRELRLIFANSDTRQLTSVELNHQAERVEALLYQLKEEGVEFPGRMRDQVAAACKVSATKLAVLKVIREGLAPSYKALYEDGKLQETAAYSLARMPADFQEKVFKACKGKLQGGAAEAMLRKLNEGWTGPDTTLTCEDGKACTHEAAFLRHDLNVTWDHCWGQTCCMKCDKAFQSWSPCDSACGKAKAEKKRRSDAKKAKETREEQKKASRNQVIADQVASLWQAMAKAAGGKLTAKEIERCTPGCYHRSDIEKMLNGEFKASSYDNGAGLYPRVDGFQDFCREKGLSADQLLGLAPAPQPEGQMVISGWMPGGTTPAEPGRFAALMDLGKKTYFRQFLRWDGTAWLFDNKSAMPLEMEPSWWMRLPDDPEKPNE